MSDNSTNEPISLDKLAEDRITKQQVVKNALMSHLSNEDNCKYTDTKAISKRLRSGKGKLILSNLSGGYTNYTYKVSCVSTGDVTTAINLFVKLCFPRAFWNPDPNYKYDVDRIANEAEMMNFFGKIAPGCVAQPYFLLDIDDMKLLATQWADQADEQLGNQFIDGVADERVAKKLAQAVAALHCHKMDESFNTEARECMIDIFPGLHSNMSKLAEEGSNRAANLARELGKDYIDNIWKKTEESYRAKDISCHADLHAFNILVEGKPDISTLERFGKNGCFVICDWEMAMVGPIGLDCGRLYSIPVACIISHTLNGNVGIETHFVEYMSLSWSEYTSEMKRLSGKDDPFFVQSYRNALAWCGWKLYAMSDQEWFMPFLGLEDNDVYAYKESIGVIGLKLMRFFDDQHMKDLDITELQTAFTSAIRDEVDHIKSAKAAVFARTSSRTRSSMLRAQNRRVSDAFIPMRDSVSRTLIATLSDMDLDD